MSTERSLFCFRSFEMTCAVPDALRDSGSRSPGMAPLGHGAVRGAYLTFFLGIVPCQKRGGSKNRRESRELRAPRVACSPQGFHAAAGLWRMPGKRARTSLERSGDDSGNRSETKRLKMLRGTERRIFSGNECVRQIAWASPACGESCGQSWRRGRPSRDAASRGTSALPLACSAHVEGHRT